MKNQQLAELLDDLKAEAGISLSAAANTQQVDHLKSLINRIYYRYYRDFAWSFLRTRFDVNVPANTRYISQPDMEEIDDVAVRDATGTIWFELEHGIDECDYNAVHEGLSQSRPRKWALYSAEGFAPTQIELWPPPDVDSIIRFRGTRKFAKLVNNSDRCQIDGTIVVLFAAAEYLARQQAPDAGMKFDLAARTYNMLRTQDSKSRKFKYKDDAKTEPRLRPYLDYIPS